MPTTVILPESIEAATSAVIPSLLLPTKVRQICTYQVLLKLECHFSWQEEENENIEVLEAVFDHIINRDELECWLEPWLEMGYSLVNVMPWEWKVYNPAIGEYETVWVHNSGKGLAVKPLIHHEL